MYQIPAIANIDHFEFKSNISFFVVENGSGKSTLLEAFAVACGLNPEGGTANYRFSTYDDYSNLASAIKLRKGVFKPKCRICTPDLMGKAFWILSREQISRDSISWMSLRLLFLRKDS